MSKYGNSKKESFLRDLPSTSIHGPTDRLTMCCKFNFAYFTVQHAGQNFHDWTHDQLAKLLDKLKDYSKESLAHWRKQRIGRSGGTVLAVYDEFPKKSGFIWPPAVPHEAQWGRFRLESAVRLVGFVVPQSVGGTKHPKTGADFDCNTFYVVFLDQNHQFYQMEDA